MSDNTTDKNGKSQENAKKVVEQTKRNSGFNKEKKVKLKLPISESKSYEYSDGPSVPVELED